MIFLRQCFGIWQTHKLRVQVKYTLYEPRPLLGIGQYPEARAAIGIGVRGLLPHRLHRGFLFVGELYGDAHAFLGTHAALMSHRLPFPEIGDPRPRGLYRQGCPKPPRRQGLWFPLPPATPE